LFRQGLLSLSLTPEPEARELRALMRPRTGLARDRAAVADRTRSVLKDADITLGAVVIDVLGSRGGR
jgi:hypothetical protein